VYYVRFVNVVMNESQSVGQFHPVHTQRSEVTSREAQTASSSLERLQSSSAKRGHVTDRCPPPPPAESIVASPGATPAGPAQHPASLQCLLR